MTEILILTLIEKALLRQSFLYHSLVLK